MHATNAYEMVSISMIVCYLLRFHVMQCVFVYETYFFFRFTFCWCKEVKTYFHLEWVANNCCFSTALCDHSTLLFIVCLGKMVCIFLVKRKCKSNQEVNGIFSNDAVKSFFIFLFFRSIFFFFFLFFT